MTRAKSIVAAFCATLLIGSIDGAAQETGKVYRVGYLTPGKESPRRMAAFRQGMRELGYVEGRNLSIKERHAGGHRQRLPALAKELASLGVDVFLTHGDATAPAANMGRAEGRPIPVVFAVAADPIGSGFVSSLAKPGGNITGLSDAHSILVPKRLELLKEVVPSIKRVAVFWSPKSPFTQGQLETLKGVAQKLGVTLIPIPFGEKADVEAAFAKLSRARPDALNVLGYPFSGLYRERVSKFARANRLPTIFTSRRWVLAGGLMSYGIDFGDQYRRAAVLVDKILKGSKPADLPVEQPTRFYLRVNMRTAREIGVSVPSAVLLRADEVVQ